MMLSLLATSFIVVCVFGTLLVTNCQSCQTSLDILVISSGFNAGNAASIELKYDATRIEYPDSWMTRGFNILVIDQFSYSIASEGHFDTYGASDEEGAEAASGMLAFLQGVQGSPDVKKLNRTEIRKSSTEYSARGARRAFRKNEY